MAVTQADIDALTSAIAGGERVVKQEGKMVEYRSVAELIAARNALQRELDASTATAAAARPRQTLLSQGGRGY